MQVKKRINRFFGNILRRDKLHELEDEEPASSSRQQRVKRKPKSNQSYSQWDLMDNAMEDAVEEDMIAAHPKVDIIYSDGLLSDDDESVNVLKNTTNMDNNSTEKVEEQKSFLKRSGSFLRKSLRRSKKLAKQSDDEVDASTWRGREREMGSLQNVVQDINSASMETAQFGYVNHQHVGKNINSKLHLPESIFETDFEDDGRRKNNYSEVRAFSTAENEIDKLKKTGLRKGLRRQASLLVSKFHKSPGSIRLKSTISVESFSEANRPHIQATISNRNTTDLQCHAQGEKPRGFTRKLSFKAAKKVVSKGASSFGKSMIHASAVMPVAYESPPISFLPDCEDDYPPHLVQCYYRTVSYQPKDNPSWTDKQDQGYSTRPTAFYQHGYCYNG